MIKTSELLGGSRLQGVNATNLLEPLEDCFTQMKP